MGDIHLLGFNLHVTWLWLTCMAKSKPIVLSIKLAVPPDHHPSSAFAIPPLLPLLADVICEQPLTGLSLWTIRPTGSWCCLCHSWSPVIWVLSIFNVIIVIIISIGIVIIIIILHHRFGHLHGGPSHYPLATGGLNGMSSWSETHRKISSIATPFARKKR